MNTTNNDRARLLAITVLAFIALVGGQWSYAKEKASPTEEGTIKVSKSVLQELIEERCETEAAHRLAQDNPDSQTKDQFTYLCINRWQVRLQGKE